MDLLQSVRKEGSRGGRGDFKWEDVKSSTHRESYLGHSLMAPVGRWQKNRDLSWYARTDRGGEQLSEADARKEEIKRVKQAEDEAMAKALGIEMPGANANMTALGNRALQSATIESQGKRRAIGATRSGSEDRERRHSHRSLHLDDGGKPRRHRERPRNEHRDRSKERSRRRFRSRSREMIRYNCRDRSTERSRQRSRSRTREIGRHHSQDRDSYHRDTGQHYNHRGDDRLHNDRQPRRSRSRSPDRKTRC